MTLPDFVIIGAMKCGTSTLHAQLAAQQQFFMSEPKEPNFFSDDAVYAKGEKWYRGLFADAPAGAIKGESSTHYAKLPTHPQTIERLAALIPEAKFIYVMRDPVDRLISHYIHEWTQGVIACPIDEAIDKHPELIAYSRYAYQLEPWVRRFGKERILPVMFETMTKEKDAELKRIAAFLGAEGDVAWKEDLEAQNVSAERIRKFPGYSLIVDNPVATFLRRTLVPQRLRDRVKSNLQMRERPELSASRIKALNEIFDRDLAALEPLIGARDLCMEYFRRLRN
ncbi:MAG TPA: sulfotransferase [Parvularculaceae bacterium]|nr:sulfotransferase [Parvularculaceae bacterium]HNS86892.1 sulfotransferase [Parvularculaceae bacterium]